VPIAEGAVSWNGFLKQVGFNPPSNYEVSAVSVIPAGPTNTGSVVELRCLDGDWFLAIFPLVSLSIDDSSIDTTNLNIDATSVIIFENNPGILQHSIIIGADVTPEQIGAFQLFDIPVTVTGLCLSPSSSMTVGGEWQPTDTTALLIGYSVLNAYWMAPVGIGIGVGVYLTRNRWQRR